MFHEYIGPTQLFIFKTVTIQIEIIIQQINDLIWPEYSTSNHIFQHEDLQS